ncbi:DUF1446 domain-containing protein [Salmonella enterica]|nr:DUF1446 domain-containing protein [Salmonella enterica]
MELENAPTNEIRILSPTAILGYGFPETSFNRGIALKPDFIAVDAGSTDPGPYYLGAGISFTDRAAVKRDISLLLSAAVANKIPLIVGTAGGSGAKPHLDWLVDIVRETAREKKLSFRMAVIDSEIEKKLVRRALSDGKIRPCGEWEELKKESIDNSQHIVAQMGTEPLIEALKQDAQVIIAGRTYDPAVFAALPIMKGFDQGLALHMGKILECAAIACDPGSGSDCMFAVLKKDHFLLHPLNEIRCCTTKSVAAHTLYEKSNPVTLPGPGGILDLSETVFEQVNDNTVKVSGSRHISKPYELKLEGSALVGYRTISFAGVRDPVFISQIDEIVNAVRARTQDNFSEYDSDEYQLIFRVYGKNGVMGDREPVSNFIPLETGIIIDAVANTQELANTICSFARSTMLHYGYTGRLSTAGNLAFPYSPSDFKAGAVYKFSIYHLLQTDSPSSFTKISFESV